MSRATRVECHAGYRADETPRRLHFDDGHVEDVRVGRRWRTPDACGFEVTASSGRRYVVLHFTGRDAWEFAEQPD